MALLRTTQSFRIMFFTLYLNVNILHTDDLFYFNSTLIIYIIIILFTSYLYYYYLFYYWLLFILLFIYLSVNLVGIVIIYIIFGIYLYYLLFLRESEVLCDKQKSCIKPLSKKLLFWYVKDFFLSKIFKDNISFLNELNSTIAFGVIIII